MARILVVDDTPRNRKLLADLLTASGYDVVLAASGAEALQRVADDRPDLVLLDVVMPEMSGYEVCRAIRARPQSAVLPVVMVTALEPSSERLKGLEAGADDFLAKPISQPELLARVRSLLRVKQLYDQVEEQASQLAEWNRSLEQRVREQVAALERLETLKRFLPPQIVEQVVAGGTDDPLASHRREIVVLALELRGFTAFAETAAPEDVMGVLQEFHLAIGRLVVDYQGTIERVTGDGMMVFFNDPLPQPDATERALRLALAVRARGRALAAQWGQRGFDLHVGLGIAQGYATLGSIGFDARSEYAAIGTVTQLAARLGEAAAAGEILVSQRLRAAIEPMAQCESAGELALRGFARPLAAFRVLDVRAAHGVASPADASAAPTRLFRREGEYWTIGYQTEWGRVRGSKGLVYVAHLLRAPGQEFHVLDLIALTRAPADGAAPLAADGDELAVGGLGDAGELLDLRAKQEYRQRLIDLRAELAEAERFADHGRAARSREEIERLAQQLAAAVGLGGRDRRAAAVTERARVNVTRAISDSLKRIRESAPLLARHLEASIRTGAFCAYQPADSSGVPWQV
ncbi:MAG: response regulator [Deltaproteobacteria bacterium]|nr:response regulator [Deltaproteobacteria bacterium]